MQDGIYLDLPHELHIAAPGRLGSTDLTRLHSRGPGWWWQSAHNPHRKEPKSETYQARGSAWHSLMLEGRKAYGRDFAVMPNPNDYPDLLVSTEDLRSAGVGAGGVGLRSKMKKHDLVQQALAHLDGAHIWDVIVERWKHKAQNKTPVPSADAYAIEAMYAQAMQDEHVRILCNTDDQVKLVEVSVFWTCPTSGIQFRYRFDSLQPTANIDLKSVTDFRSRPFADTCADRIANDHLDVQLAMSHEARLAAYQLIEAGAMFEWVNGKAKRASGPRAAYLKRLPKDAPLDAGAGAGWCWVWLFYQWPDGGAAPSLLPVRVLWGDQLHRSGWRKMQGAIATYLANVKRFGIDRPWTSVHPIHDTADNGRHRFNMPIWADTTSPTPGEADALRWKGR